MRGSKLLRAAPVVRTTTGVVRGHRAAGVETFLGVPYAAPPIGPSRFRKPRPHPGWEGVRPAVAFGDAPVQPVFDDAGQKRYGVFEDHSEDCLVLNVWTPAGDPAARLPVIVFLHGGGYFTGSGAVGLYDGSVHAHEGVVWVTVNHRLGGAGFMYLDELFPSLSGTGNLGIWDQVQALAWLRENVAAFGGDPDRIAVAGSSAGALSVAALLAAPAARETFRRGLVLSSRAGHASLDTGQATAVARVFLDAVGVAPGDLDALLAMPAQRLALDLGTLFGPMREAAGQHPLGPVVDGDLLTAPVIDAIRAGAGGQLDVVAGTTTEESRGELLDEDGRPRPGVSLDAAERLPPGADLDVYRRSLAAQGLPVDDVELTTAVVSDDVMVQPTLALAAARVRAGGSGATYVYRFAWRSPGAGGRTGALHGLATPFLTGNMRLPGWRSWLGAAPPLATADVFRHAVQAFAATGDPDLPGWDPYTLPRRPTLWLDEDVTVVDDPQCERRELWAPVYDPVPSERSTITHRLADRAADDVLVVTADGTGRTARQCRAEVARRAAALAALGVGPGDRVATLQELHLDALLTWWAVDRLGARFLPLNPAWTPRLAGRVLHDRGPVLLVADDALRELAGRSVAAAGSRLPVVDTADLDRPDAPTPPHVPHGELDDCVIVHNSGLPGIHHGVRTSARMLRVMSGNMIPGRGLRVLVGGRTCFMGVLVSVYGAIAGDGSVALLPGLTAGTFWPAVRCTGVTFAAMLDPTVADLLALPPSADDRDHPLRVVTAPPGTPELNARAAARFGVSWHTGMAKTEVCGAVVSDLNPPAEQGSGRIRAPYEGRVVDPAGAPVAVDEPGELVLRSHVPGALPVGYADDAAASAHLWRGGWLHTGWHVRQDAAGCVHTVGNASIDPIVVKRAGYLFAADLEAEIVEIGTGVTAARVEIGPGADPLADPVVTVHVDGTHDMATLRAELTAGLPAHLVPDRCVPAAGPR